LALNQNKRVPYLRDTLQLDYYGIHIYFRKISNVRMRLAFRQLFSFSRCSCPSQVLIIV
jgi:hypothetical protein